jgi:small ligand-binding sensory domain FIST
MRFSAAASRVPKWIKALDEILVALPPGPADFVIVFLTSHHRGAAIGIADSLRERLSPGALVGCTCEGVVGPEDEIEREPGISVFSATLPGIIASPFHVMPSEMSVLMENPSMLRPKFAIGESTRALFLLGDPFSCPVEPLLDSLNTNVPGLKVLGGMASGASRPWDNALIMNDELHTDGLVGFSLGGAIEVETVVSQGCRPIGGRLVVSEVEGPLLKKLGNMNALEAIQNQIDNLSDKEQALVENGLSLGVAVSEYREEFRRGDFLIRNIMGVDPDTGAVAVGDEVRPGQTVQLHVRDAQTAGDDLRDLLSESMSAEPPLGALLFSCNGRGSRMFDAPGHDVRTLQAIYPGIPVAGFFAMGEIGPIQGRNCLHGHTASIALFSEPKEKVEN